MAEQMKRYSAFNYFYSILLCLLLSCKGDQYLEQLYQKRDYLMQFSKDKTFIKSRGKNMLVLRTFRNNCVNEYYVYLDSGIYRFQRDTLQYTPDIIAFKSVVSSKEYEEEVCKYVEIVNKELSLFGIDGFRTDFVSLGEPLKFYMKDGKTVVFIPDMNRIPKNNDYQKSLKRLGDFWYYTE